MGEDYLQELESGWAWDNARPIPLPQPLPRTL
jgi:hypothetical protein